MCNECLKRGRFPEHWKIAKIIPITKPGKKDSYDPSKYRQISLLNTEGNVLEKLLINRITRHLYERRTESHEQLFFVCELRTAEEGECGGRWNQLLPYP